MCPSMVLCVCVREHSRNARLSEESRSSAPAIYQALQWAAGAKAQGSLGAPAAVAAEIRKRLEAAGGTVDYVEVGLGEEQATCLLVVCLCRSIHC